MHLLDFERKNHPDLPLAEPNKTLTSCVHAHRILCHWRKMFFVLSRAWDEENILSSNGELNFRPSVYAL